MHLSAPSRFAPSRAVGARRAVGGAALVVSLALTGCTTTSATSVASTAPLRGATASPRMTPLASPPRWTPWCRRYPPPSCPPPGDRRPRGHRRARRPARRAARRPGGSVHGPGRLPPAANGVRRLPASPRDVGRRSTPRARRPPARDGPAHRAGRDTYGMVGPDMAFAAPPRPIVESSQPAYTGAMQHCLTADVRAARPCRADSRTGASTPRARGTPCSPARTTPYVGSRSSG